MKRKYERPELQRFGKFRDLTKDWCSDHPVLALTDPECRTS